MKCKNVLLFGNVFMGLGLVVMVVGVGYFILNQFLQFNLLQFFVYGVILSIFVGVVFWLVGVCIGGYEQVSDCYWWVCYYDKCCCCNQYCYS